MAHVSHEETQTGTANTVEIATLHTFSAFHYAPPQRVVIKPRRARAKSMRVLQTTKQPSCRCLLSRSCSWTLRRSTSVHLARSNLDDNYHSRLATPRFPVPSVMPVELSKSTPSGYVDANKDVSHPEPRSRSLSQRCISASQKGSKNERQPTPNPQRQTRQPYMMRVCQWIQLKWLVQRELD